MNPRNSHLHETLATEFNVKMISHIYNILELKSQKRGHLKYKWKDLDEKDINILLWWWHWR